ncbi:MAG: hypothetical protein R2838_24780 [Caldilineaceae bacterium]
MSKRDYYEVLGVERTVDKATLARLSPAGATVPPGRQQIARSRGHVQGDQQAYQVLNDDQRRAYDRFGHARLEGGMGGGYADFSGFGDIGSIFEEFFGGFGASSGTNATPAAPGSGPAPTSA